MPESEKHGLLILLAMICLSAGLLILPPTYLWSSGFLLMIWGGFSAWRFAGLTRHQTAEKKLHWGALPERILALFHWREVQDKQKGRTRLDGQDIRIFLTLGLIWIGWICFSNFFPVLPKSVHVFADQIAGFFPFVYDGDGDYQFFNLSLFIRQICLFITLGLLALVMQSYAYHQKMVMLVLVLFLPVLFMVGAWMVAFEGRDVFSVQISPACLSFQGLRGAGLGAQAFIDQECQSAALFRIFAYGSIGIDIFYVLFLPILFAFFQKTGMWFLNLLGLFLLLILGVSDFLIPARPFSTAFYFIGFVCLSACWGQAGFYWQKNEPLGILPR